MWNYNQTEYLCHHGIRGQRWGVRRFQDSSGKLTSAGEKRYKSDDRLAFEKARGDLKSARKQYSKDFNKTFIYDELHPFSKHIKNTKGYEQSNKNWDKTFDSTVKYSDARYDYKNAKKTYKQTDDYSKRRQRNIKIGAAVAGTALAAYGAYKVSKYATHMKVKAGRRSEYLMMERLDNLNKQWARVDMSKPGAKDRINYLYDAKNKTVKNFDANTNRVEKSAVQAAKYLYKTRNFGK